MPVAVAGIAALGLAAAACSSSEPAVTPPVVEVFGNMVGAEGREFGDVLRRVGAGAGVELRYVGVTSFVEQLTDRLEQGDRPDVVLLPQPGVLADLDRRGLVAPLPAGVAATSQTDFPAGLVELVDLGRPAAVWVTLEVKGLVWYRPSVFADLGLRVPATLDELAALAEQVRSGTDGVAPWCVAAEAGASTGWVGTDWVELYVLRRLGAEAYDRWTVGELRFDDPAVASVFAELDTLLRRPGAVAGGSRTTLTTPWARVADPMVANPPRCLMVQQAEFLRDSFPAGVRVGPGGDVDVFFLPPARAGEEPPMLVSGLLAAPLDTGPEVEEAMRVLASARLAEELNRTGRFVSPNLTAGAGLDELSAGLIRQVNGAAVVRFDGSDLMPAAVGTGTFWAGMRAFLAGEELAAVLATIQAGWDQTPA